MMPTTRLRLLGRCIAWGFFIEAPVLAWFLSVQTRAHVSMIPGILFVFHFASYCLMRIFLFPFERRISDETMNWLGYSLIGCLQAIIIGCALFVHRLQKQRTSEEVAASRRPTPD
jgi:prolipoprotein diacylglyceryltransferase